MNGDIVKGHFLLKPKSNPLGGFGIEDVNYAVSVVRIKMEDNCWYNVKLQRRNGKDQWHIGYLDIVMDGEKSMGYLHLPIPKREELAEKILNFNQFRIPFLFV